MEIEARREGEGGRSTRQSLLQRVAEFLFGPYDVGPGREVLNLLAFVWVMIGIGLLSLLVPAAAQGSLEGFYRVVGVGLFVVGAGTAAGSMLGFLFGVPKSSAHVVDSGESLPGARMQMYVPNTNLETISDWLTKVVVGVGLVELKDLIPWVYDIGSAAGHAMVPDGGTTMAVIATSLAVHSVLMGFFQGFLVAYLYLPKAFSAAQRSANVPGPTPIPTHD